MAEYDTEFTKEHFGHYDRKKLLAKEYTEEEMLDGHFLHRCCINGDLECFRVLGGAPYNCDAEDLLFPEPRACDLSGWTPIQYCYRPQSGARLLAELMEPPWNLSPQQVVEHSIHCFTDLENANPDLFDTINPSGMPSKMQKRLLDLIYEGGCFPSFVLTRMNGKIMSEYVMEVSYEELQNKDKEDSRCRMAALAPILQYTFARRGFVLNLMYKIRANKSVTPFTLLPTHLMAEIVNKSLLLD